MKSGDIKREHSWNSLVYRLFNRTGGPAKSFVPRTTDSTHGKGYWPNLLLNQSLPQKPNLIWQGRLCGE